jgi:hypothetical protein
MTTTACTTFFDNPNCCEDESGGREAKEKNLKQVRMTVMTGAISDEQWKFEDELLEC